MEEVRVNDLDFSDDLWITPEKPMPDHLQDRGTYKVLRDLVDHLDDYDYQIKSDISLINGSKIQDSVKFNAAKEFIRRQEQE